MLKWTKQGRGQGEDTTDHTTKMPFLKSKKSFKTTPLPPNSSKPPPGPAYQPPLPSNGSTKTNGAPPSPANSHSSTSSSDLARNVGQRHLEISLPSGKEVTATVDAKMPMMDLLVMVSQTNKLNPTGHVIIPASLHKTDIAQFKASQLVGRLDTTRLQIVPKLSQREIESIRGSEKKKAAQFEETIRVTLISEKNQKTLVRVSPHKPIQELLPIIHEETGLEISDFRLRLLKKPDEDIDYSKSLDFYGGVNELRLIDLRPPPPQEAEPAPIEKKKKSMFGRKTKKKDVPEVSHHTTEKSHGVEAPSKETVAAPPVAVVPPEPSVHNAHAKRRPAPPPPPGGKKESAPPQQNGGQLLKPSTEAVSRAAHGVSKKRRAPAPPPAGGPPGAPHMAQLPEHAMQVTVNGTDKEHHIEANFSAEVEGAPSVSPPASSSMSSPQATPDSTLDRKRDEGVDAMATVDDVEFSLQDLDEDQDPNSLSASTTSNLIHSMEVAFEEVLALGRESLVGDQVAAEEGSIVSEVSLASNDQSQPPPPCEDPESGEKVRCNSTTSNNEDEEEKTVEAQVEDGDQSEPTTEEASDSKPDEVSYINRSQTACEKMLHITAPTNSSKLENTHGDAVTNKPTPQVGASVAVVKAVSEDVLRKSPVPRPRHSGKFHAYDGKERAQKDQKIKKSPPEVISVLPSSETTGPPKSPKPSFKKRNSGGLQKQEKQRPPPPRPPVKPPPVIKPPPPVTTPIQSNQALSSLQTAFLEALNKRQVDNAPSSKDTPTKPSSLKHKKPQQPPPLPPAFLKNRSVSTTDIYSGEPVKLPVSPLSKQLEVRPEIVPVKNQVENSSQGPPQQGLPGNTSVKKSAHIQELQSSNNARTEEPVPPARRKKKSVEKKTESEMEPIIKQQSIDESVDGKESEDSTSGSKTEPKPVPTERTKKSQKKKSPPPPVPGKSFEDKVKEVPILQEVESNQPHRESARTKNSGQQRDVSSPNPVSKCAVIVEKAGSKTSATSETKREIKNKSVKHVAIADTRGTKAATTRTSTSGFHHAPEDVTKKVEETSTYNAPEDVTKKVEETSTYNELASLVKDEPAVIVNADGTDSLSGELESAFRRDLGHINQDLGLDESMDKAASVHDGDDDVFHGEPSEISLSDPVATSSFSSSSGESDYSKHRSESTSKKRHQGCLETTISTTDRTQQEFPPVNGKMDGAGTADLPSKSKSFQERSGMVQSKPKSHQQRTEAVQSQKSSSHHPTSSSVPSVNKENSEQRVGRATLTKMMKLSLDEDSNDTTSYSPTTHEEDDESFLEEKSVSSLAASMTREPVESGPDGLEKAKGLEDQEGEVDKKSEEREKEHEKKKDIAVVGAVSLSVNSAPSNQTATEEDKKDKETEDAEKSVTPEKADGRSQQPTMEQLTEQYKQLQQQMAMMQQQLMLNPAAAQINPATGQVPVTPAVAYQAQQMQQMQQLMMQQQLLLQQQQQQSMMSPPQGGYMMVPQAGGGMMMFPQMGMPTMPTMPVYGQMTPPQAVSTSSVDEHHVSQNQETPPSSAPQSSDETDAAEPKVSFKPSSSTESVPEETPVKLQTDAAPSGRRNVFADILKKKNTSKSTYLLSAKRESQKHHDSKPVLPSKPSALRDGSAKGHASVKLNTSHPESRTELSIGATSPGTQDSVVHSSLSPTSHVAPPHGSVIPSPPPLPQSASLTANTPPSPEESNNNKAKTISLEADITATSKLPSVEASTTSTVHSTLPPPPASMLGDKNPPVTLPKPRVGPRPYSRRVPSTDSEPKSFSDHARKVADLRSDNH